MAGSRYSDDDADGDRRAEKAGEWVGNFEVVGRVCISNGLDPERREESDVESSDT
jgi:hypothetical protein